MVVHVCIQSSLVAEARRIKRPAWVHSEFQTRLGHVARPCVLKQTKTNKQQKQINRKEILSNAYHLPGPILMLHMYISFVSFNPPDNHTKAYNYSCFIDVETVSGFPSQDPSSPL